ncbi:hypothetical protein [Achromobacter denitrificans]|uniref:hypothetical protein n=1 Tax=Achromobacter denitrificans TaxID=32002 RepID=UPI000B492917|nr:hypothetical protein [Achromobacter denitrificans]
MQLDTNIALQARGPQIESPINTLFNVARLRSAQAQLGEQERQAGERNALAGVLRSPDTFGADGRFNRSALPAIAQASPGAALQYAGLANQQDASAGQGELRRMQVAKQNMEMQGRLLQGVNDESTYQSAKQAAAQAGMDVSQLPASYDPAWVNQARARTMSQLDQFDMLYRQQMMELQRDRLARDTGNFSAPVQTNRGLVQTNARGEQKWLEDNGERVLPASIDPNAQGSVAQAKARGTAQGKAQVENEQGLGQAEATANQIMGVIDKAINHPGREYATGLSSMAPIIAGTDAADFNTVLDQIKGQAFLQAFQSLKGGGQITEVEGTKATQAIARLDRAQSEEEFVKSLQELRGIVEAGMERARRKAGAGNAPLTPPAAPQARQVARRGRLPDGRQVVEYTDGTREVIQ